MGIFRGPGGTGDATGDAANEATLAIAAAQAAESSKNDAANSAAQAATSASAAADNVDEAFSSIVATASTLTEGSSATANFNSSTKVLALGLPTGATGPQGPAGPNDISSSTTVTGLTGVLKVAGGVVSGSATASDVGAADASATVNLTGDQSIEGIKTFMANGVGVVMSGVDEVENTPFFELKVQSLGVNSFTPGLIIGQYGVNGNGSGSFVNSSRVFNETAGNLLLGTNNAERMRIDSDGNVGIGTSSPNSNFKLEVAGTSFAQMITTSIFGVIGNNLFFGTGDWRYSGNGHGYGWAQSGTNGSDLVLNYAPNNTSSTGAVVSSLSERMRITSDGNLLIGTNSPITSFRLEVAGRQFIQDATQPTIYLGNTTSDYNAVFYDPPSKIGYVSAEGAGTQLVFRTVATERMRINSAGNVGIGSSNPLEKLDVAGNVRIRGTGEANMSVGGTTSQFVFTATDSDYAVISATGTHLGTAIVYGAGVAVFDNATGTLDVDGTVSATTFRPAAGSVSAPAFSTSGDTNTGMFFPAADSIAFATTGSERVTIDSNGVLTAAFGLRSGGNVRVAQGSANVAAVTTTNDVNTGMFFPIADNLAFTTGGSERMRIDTSGNVGIGTSSPLGKVVVDGASLGNWSSSNYGRQLLVYGSGTNPSIGIYDANSVNPIALTNNSGAFVISRMPAVPTNSTTAPIEYMRIDSSGNVGIGTSSPTDVLDVRGGIRSTDGTTTSRIISASNTCFIGSLTAAPIVFQVNNAERMRIDSSGNVGIGTSTTTYRTNIVYSGTAGGIAETGLYLRNSSTGNSTQMQFDGHRNWSLMVQGSFGAPAGGFTIQDNTAGANRLSIDSSGNVGIGTSSPAQKLDVNGDARLNGSLLWASSGGTNNFIEGSSVSDVLRIGTISQERMRIDSSGNLLINCTAVPNVSASPQQFGVASSSTNEFVVSRNNNGAALYIKNVGGATATAIIFFNGSSSVGSVTTTASTTAYNTSSDYRLKENIAPMTGALETVAQLKPVTYNWKADGSDGQGFIAHELAEVVPECVTGEKDAVDKDGKPVYQGIDTSFLVATLTKAIQELKAELDVVKAELNTLKGN